MEANGQKLTWLAAQIGISVGHLHSVLKGKGHRKQPLTDENKAKIAQALKIEL